MKGAVAIKDESKSSTTPAPVYKPFPAFRSLQDEVNKIFEEFRHGFHFAPGALENFEKLENNLYKVTKSHYFKGKYIYKDDIFRFEDSSESELKIALNDFFKLSNNSFNEVIFYTIKYKTKYNLQNLLNN